MSTNTEITKEKRAKINRENSTHSTGPRTAEGKAIASRNSTRHTLTSTRVVLPHESQEEYDELHASLISKYEPMEGQESREVQQVAELHWRLERCLLIETQMCDNRVGALLNNADGPSIGFHEDERAFDKLGRYITAIERSYCKALRKLDASQSARRLQEEKQKNGSVSQNGPSATQTAVKTEASTNGFVSKKPAATANQTPEQPAGKKRIGYPHRR
jgi:hypothetical protein